MKKLQFLGVTVAALSIVTAACFMQSADASPTGSLTQTINTGVLATDIKDTSNVTVPSPTFDLSAATIVTACQTTHGTYGTDSQRVAVDNPGMADNGWTLSIAATNGSSAKWTAGSNNYDFDDPSGSGCDNGQLTIDPSAATLNVESGTPTGVTLGSLDAFNSNSSITLLSADGSSDDFWRGYLTGIDISQKIPASTPSGSYALDLTQTIINI